MSGRNISQSRNASESSNLPASIITNPSPADKRLVASSTKKEKMLSKKSQTESRLDKVDSALIKILQFMKSC